LQNDIETCEAINQAIKSKRAPFDKNYQLAELIMVAPPLDQQFGFELDFSPQQIEKNIELGYQIAKDVQEGDALKF
jgi:hypothetical protein